MLTVCKGIDPASKTRIFVRDDPLKRPFICILIPFKIDGKFNFSLAPINETNLCK